MQYFSLPGKTTSGLNKIARDFFWNKTNNHRGFPTVSWDKICRPKKFGGLGLRKIEAINNAFQCKLAWKILTNQTSYRVRSMKLKYLHQGSYLNCTLKPSDSPVWESVVCSKDVLSAGLIWQIGNGSSVSFWFDNWLETNCL